MTISLDIPGHLASQLNRPGQNLALTVPEDMAVEAHLMRRLAGIHLHRLLGIESRFELDGFFKARRAWLARDPKPHRKLSL